MDLAAYRRGVLAAPDDLAARATTGGATDEELAALQAAYARPEGFLADCVWCGEPDAAHYKRTRRGWPYAQCSHCQVQVQVRGLPAQQRVVEVALRSIRRRAGGAP